VRSSADHRVEHGGKPALLVDARGDLLVVVVYAGGINVLNIEVEGPAPRVVSSEVVSADGAVVIVDGELDIETAPQLGRQIGELIGDGHRHLVIDLSGAAFLDSTAMRTLVTTIAPLREDATAGVVLAGVHGAVQRALAVSGIGELFTAFDTRNEALEGMNVTAPSLREGWRTVVPRRTD
jgi:anti-anti-sigma factor